MFDDERCTADDVGGNLGGECECSMCVPPSHRVTMRETLDRLGNVFGPRPMSYDDWSEFQRLKHADVEQGRRIAELLGENAQLAAENRALRTEAGDLAHDLRNARLEIEELKAANERLRRQPWEGHWS